MEDVDWMEWLDLISWTGAWRSCLGCLGFILWFSLHPNVDACSSGLGEAQRSIGCLQGARLVLGSM